MFLQQNLFPDIPIFDAQFGIFPKETVPKPLIEALVGDPRPPAKRCSELQCYAVLDGAKHPYILEAQLQNSGLHFQSLLNGQALSDWGEHGPFLVQLTLDNNLTRLLFSRDTPGALWDLSLGMFFRSRATFNDMRKHLRRFLMLPGPNQRMNYFRFWEGSTASAFWGSFAEDQHQVGWRYGKVIEACLFQSGANMVEFSTVGMTETQSVPPKALDPYLPLFRRARWERFVEILASELAQEDPPIRDQAGQITREQLHGFCEQVHKAGYSREAAIWNMVLAFLWCRHHGLDWSKTATKALENAPAHNPAHNDVCSSERILQAARHPNTPEQPPVLYQ